MYFSFLLHLKYFIDKVYNLDTQELVSDIIYKFDIKLQKYIVNYHLGKKCFFPFVACSICYKTCET